jgi:hypothetical protein
VQLPSDLAERCADVIPIIMLVMGFAKGSTHPCISAIAYNGPFREEWPSPGDGPSWVAVRSDRYPSKP